MEKSPTQLKLESVAKTYANPEGGASLPVLTDVNLEVRRNESIAVIGPSGSGKSTLLNIIGALDRPTAGKIFLENENLLSFEEKQLAAIRNQKIGFIFQDHHLLPQCTVLENVLVPTIIHPAANTSACLKRAKELLDRVGLSDRFHYKPARLSGGERQRVAYVRALINQPILLLADEPTGALDRDNAIRLMELLTEINKDRGLTSIIVTHAVDLVKNLDRVYELKNGCLYENALHRGGSRTAPT
ncbi:MAG: ABC transporter ATP-binding protein [Candidatus Omnitrophota bacterium]|jgi:ABC-type lipoprotein export system ATPase subunit|nr:MAG: ABC transporter ATP-binding protein [Candidatus Omnitrophota bacterium]